MRRQRLDTEQVVAAAARLADEEGLAAVTLSRLAAILGVRAPSLYNHVDGHEGLLRLIRLLGIEQLNAAISDAAVGLAGEDALRATAHAYRAYALAHPGVYEATLAAPPGDDAELEAAGWRIVELLAAMLRGWELEGDEAIDAIRVVRSALHGFVALERAGGFAIERDRDSSFERLIDTLVAGLSAPPGEP